MHTLTPEKELLTPEKWTLEENFLEKATF